MRVVLYEPNEKLLKFLQNQIILNGFIPKPVDNPFTLYSEIANAKPDILLLDYSEKHQDFLNDLFFDIKLNNDLKNIKIFLMVNNPDKTTLEFLLKLSIKGFIRKPFQEHLFKSTFAEWLRQSNPSGNKRAHIRVNPLPSDNAYLCINTEFARGVVKFPIRDISAGGLSLLIPRSFQEFTERFYSPGRLIKKVNIKIRYFSIEIDVEVVNTQTDRVGLRFVDENNPSLRYIYRFIMDSVNALDDI